MVDELVVNTLHSEIYGSWRLACRVYARVLNIQSSRDCKEMQCFKAICRDSLKFCRIWHGKISEGMPLIQQTAGQADRQMVRWKVGGGR
jgi:hypothetical protein